jgi:hypothetical protein
MKHLLDLDTFVKTLIDKGYSGFFILKVLMQAN